MEVERFHIHELIRRGVDVVVTGLELTAQGPHRAALREVVATNDAARAAGVCPASGKDGLLAHIPERVVIDADVVGKMLRVMDEDAPADAPAAVHDVMMHHRVIGAVIEIDAEAFVAAHDLHPADMIPRDDATGEGAFLRGRVMVGNVNARRAAIHEQAAHVADAVVEKARMTLSAPLTCRPLVPSLAKPKR